MASSLDVNSLYWHLMAQIVAGEAARKNNVVLSLGIGMHDVRPERRSEGYSRLFAETVGVLEQSGSSTNSQLPDWLTVASDALTLGPVYAWSQIGPRGDLPQEVRNQWMTALNDLVTRAPAVARQLIDVLSAQAASK